MASDGTVLVPTDAELAAAANASDPSTAWLGCIVAEGALIDGSVVAVASGVATAEECCRACRANSTCNVWNYCAQPGGCRCAVQPGRAGWAQLWDVRMLRSPTPHGLAALFKLSSHAPLACAATTAARPLAALQST